MLVTAWSGTGRRNRWGHCLATNACHDLTFARKENLFSI